MEYRIQGRVAMVAASSKGIGFATAKALAKEGCILSICARNEAELASSSAQIGEETRSYVVDVASPDDLAWWLQSTKDDLGAPSILVTNTGGPPAGTIGEMTDDQWHQGVEGTLMNVIRLSRLLQPEMAAQGWGRIVHLTSLVAKEPNKILPISSTLRSGLMALTRIQATEYGPQGITVNGVLPGHTLTDRQTHLAEVRGQKEGITPEEALKRQTAEIPLGRMAAPEEIAAAVAFLCSEPASYITGVNLLVDGGLTKGLA